MKTLIKFIGGTMATIGIILIYCSASTSDYHVFELGEREPEYIWPTMVFGMLLVLPALIYMIVKESR